MMTILKRDYYPLPIAASNIGCTADDLIHLAANGRTRLGVLFHADLFTDEEVSLAVDAPEGNVMDVRGFAYLERRCMEEFEQVGNCIFNAVEMLDGKRVFIAGTRGRASRPEDVYMHASDIRALLEGEGIEKPLSATDRAHVSDRLAKTNQAAAKFWANADRADRGTHPENAIVSAWLVERGFSKTLADSAATIIRPEWAPTGRKPEQ
jgi:hypothetical protein